MKPKLNKPGKTQDSADAPEPHGAALDRYDIAILGELQRDARLSNTELASRIGLSAAPVTMPGPTSRRNDGRARRGRPVSGVDIDGGAPDGAGVQLSASLGKPHAQALSEDATAAARRPT